MSIILPYKILYKNKKYIYTSTYIIIGAKVTILMNMWKDCPTLKL